MLIVEQRARAVLAISDYTYVLGGGQVLMADTPARLSASQEFTESFFGAVPQTPKSASPVLTGGGADPAAEHPVHMTLVGEAALVGHLSQWDARPPQQRLALATRSSIT